MCILKRDIIQEYLIKYCLLGHSGKLSFIIKIMLLFLEYFPCLFASNNVKFFKKMKVKF